MSENKQVQNDQNLNPFENSVVQGQDFNFSKFSFFQPGQQDQRRQSIQNFDYYQPSQQEQQAKDNEEFINIENLENQNIHDQSQKQINPNEKSNVHNQSYQQDNPNNKSYQQNLNNQLNIHNQSYQQNNKQNLQINPNNQSNMHNQSYQQDNPNNKSYQQNLNNQSNILNQSQQQNNKSNHQINPNNESKNKINPNQNNQTVLSQKQVSQQPDEDPSLNQSGFNFSDFDKFEEPDFNTLNENNQNNQQNEQQTCNQLVGDEDYFPSNQKLQLKQDSLDQQNKVDEWGFGYQMEVNNQNNFGNNQFTDFGTNQETQNQNQNNNFAFQFGEQNNNNKENNEDWGFVNQYEKNLEQHSQKSIKFEEWGFNNIGEKEQNQNNWGFENQEQQKIQQDFSGFQEKESKQNNWGFENQEQQKVQQNFSGFQEQNNNQRAQQNQQKNQNIKDSKFQAFEDKFNTWNDKNQIKTPENQNQMNQQQLLEQQQQNFQKDLKLEEFVKQIDFLKKEIQQRDLKIDQMSMEVDQLTVENKNHNNMRENRDYLYKKMNLESLDQLFDQVLIGIEVNEKKKIDFLQEIDEVIYVTEDIIKKGDCSEDLFEKFQKRKEVLNYFGKWDNHIVFRELENIMREYHTERDESKEQEKDFIQICREYQKQVKMLQKTIQNNLEQQQQLNKEIYQLQQENINLKDEMQSQISLRDDYERILERLNEQKRKLFEQDQEINLLKSTNEKQSKDIQELLLSDTHERDQKVEKTLDQLDFLEKAEKENQQQKQPQLVSDVARNTKEIMDISKKTDSPNKPHDALTQFILTKKKKLQVKNIHNFFYDPKPFEKILRLPLYQNQRNQVNNFKYSCLKNQAILYENENIQIGIVTQFILQELDQVFNIQIHFYNKQENNIEIAMNIIDPHLQKNMREECQSFPLRTLMFDESIVHDIQISQFSEQIDIPVMNLQINNINNENLMIPLPATINKFIQFQFIDQYSFMNKWRQWKKFKFTNEPREVNPKFVRELHDFKRYFETFIPLHKNNKFYMIGMFNLNGISPFLIKIQLTKSLHESLILVQEEKSQEQNYFSNNSNNNNNTYRNIKKYVKISVSSYESFKNQSYYIANYLCFAFTI